MDHVIDLLNKNRVRVDEAAQLEITFHEEEDGSGISIVLHTDYEYAGKTPNVL